MSYPTGATLASNDLSHPDDDDAADSFGTDDHPAGEPQGSPASKTEDAGAAKKPGPKRTAPKSAGVDAAIVRRVLSKRDEVVSATEAQRSILAGLLTVDNDVDPLTVAILAGRGNINALSDLSSLIELPAALTAITLMQWERERQIAAWNVLAGLDVVSGRYPTAETKAVLSFVEAVGGLAAGKADELSAVVELARG